VADGFVFGYYDVDDIKQEAFIIASNAVMSYDASKSQLATFLRTSIVRRLMTLKRDKFRRTDLPCHQCKLSDECEYEENRNLCSRYDKWIERNRIKGELVANMQTDVVAAHKYEESDYHTPLDNDRLRQYIDENLPFPMRKTYLLWRDGMKVGGKEKLLLFEYLREILEDYCENEEEDE